MWTFAEPGSSRPIVYLDPRSRNARRILGDMDFDMVNSPEFADLLWLRRGYREAYGHLKQHQLINHIPNEGAMIDKGRLTGNLKALDRSGSVSDPSLDAFYQES